MLLGGGYTKLLWIIMGITGISVRIWLIMGITGISVRIWLIMRITGISVRTWIIMGITGISVRKMIIGNRPGRLEYNQKTLRLRKRIKRSEKNLVHGETRKSAKALTKREKNF